MNIHRRVANSLYVHAHGTASASQMAANESSPRILKNFEVQCGMRLTHPNPRKTPTSSPNNCASMKRAYIGRMAPNTTTVEIDSVFNPYRDETNMPQKSMDTGSQGVIAVKSSRRVSPRVGHKVSKTVMLKSICNNATHTGVSATANLGKK